MPIAKSEQESKLAEILCLSYLSEFDGDKTKNDGATVWTTFSTLYVYETWQIILIWIAEMFENRMSKIL